MVLPYNKREQMLLECGVLHSAEVLGGKNLVLTGEENSVCVWDDADEMDGMCVWQLLMESQRKCGRLRP